MIVVVDTTNLRDENTLAIETWACKKTRDLFSGKRNTIVPPQVAIVGVGRLRDRVVAVDGEIMIHPLLPLSVTFDHRAVTGGEAARFMAALLTDLEKVE